MHLSLLVSLVKQLLNSEHDYRLEFIALPLIN